VLRRIDRVQLAVPDRAAAARGWVELLGAEHAGDDRVASLAARRSRYRLGSGFVELLEPDGAGAVSRAVARWSGHLFAAGVSVDDVAAAARRLVEQDVAAAVEAGQIHVDPRATGGHGLRLVISAHQPRPPVGAVRDFYEVTNLVHDVKRSCDRLVALFGLDPAAFVPIESQAYGYAGTLTLFDPERLDRIEVIAPHVPGNTMGRFFARRGESLYMAFAECPDLAALAGRLRERGARFTAVPPERGGEGRAVHTLFVHPPGLGGMMLGLSRPDYAWSWSGRPERAAARP